MIYEQKKAWLTNLRAAASIEMTPPSYGNLVQMFEELESAWAALEQYAQLHSLAVEEDLYENGVHIGTHMVQYNIADDNGALARSVLNDHD